MYSAPDKAKLFPEIFSENTSHGDLDSFVLFSLQELIWNGMIFL